MTDPKTLTDEQIDEIIERYAEDDQLLLCVVGRSQTRELARAIERATREQTAGTGDEFALNLRHADCHRAADAFWQYWKLNGETHKHGYYESTWGAINCAIRTVGVVPHTYSRTLAENLAAAPVEQAGSPPLVNPAQPAGKEKT